jgi:DNA-binding transcriptional LysR family regulator
MLAKVSDADLRLLRVYMAVVECGGFAAAQALLNVSESTISTHMHDLETRLGLRLCQRGRGGFRLTDDGDAVYRAARELFDSLDRFQSQVTARKRQMSGTISIGIPDTIITHPEFFLSKAIERFYSQDHAVQITIQTLTPRELERGVLEGSLQFAIAPHHQKIAGLQYVKLFSEVNYFYCSRQHPLFNSINRKPTVEEIGRAGLIGRGYLTKFDRKFFGTSLHKGTVFSMEAAAVLILSGKFGGFLPSHYAQRWVETDEMRALRPDLLTFAPDFGILTRKGRDVGLAAKTLIAELRTAGTRL